MAQRVKRLPAMREKETGSGSAASSEVPLCAKVTASLLMLINFSASNYPLYSWVSLNHLASLHQFQVLND